MGELAEVRFNQVATAADVRAHSSRIQEILRGVMKKDVHYGTVPGTDKPMLYKQGAELLSVTFRIAPSYKVEELSAADAVRYRVTCIGTHQGSGVVLGEGMGECSSNEEKYKWRKGYEKEFNATDPGQRRVKYYGDKEVKQIRTQPADVANTVLKMACKRAYVAMILSVTGASDIFGQDLEDLPPEIAERLAADERKPAPPAAAKPAYSDDALKKNTAAWADLIIAGKKTAAQIIATIESKATLTDAQKQAISAIGKPATEDPGAAEPADDGDLPY